MIFDCDGVLVDTELISNTVLAALLTEAGIPTTFEDCMRDFRGRSLESVWTIVNARGGVAAPTDLAARYYAEVEAVFARELEPVPGVIAALDRIALPACVASSGPHHKMAVTLRTTGLWERFEGRIFSATEVARGQARARPLPACGGADGLRPRQHAPSSRTACPASRPRSPRACGRSAFTRHGDPAELAAAGGEPFSDMAELPALLEA